MNTVDGKSWRRWRENTGRWRAPGYLLNPPPELVAVCLSFAQFIGLSTPPRDQWSAVCVGYYILIDYTTPQEKISVAKNVSSRLRLHRIEKWSYGSDPMYAMLQREWETIPSRPLLPAEYELPSPCNPWALAWQSRRWVWNAWVAGLTSHFAL